MTAHKHMVVRLYGATRRNLSSNGNPRFWLHTSEGDFTTKSDSMISYGVENIVHTIPQGDEGILVVLKMTPADRVFDIIRADEEGSTPTGFLTLLDRALKRNEEDRRAEWLDHSGTYGDPPDEFRPVD